MFGAVWEWVKGIFGGKGAVQVGSANKAISGVTVGDNAGGVVVGDGNTVHFASSDKDEPEPPPQPIVQLRLALANHPGRGIVHFLCITIRNATGKSLFIKSFLLEMNDNQNLYVPNDSITGEPQRKRELRDGDEFTFHIEAKNFHEIGRPATDYVCAFIEDAAGPPYKSTTKDIQDCVADLLKDTQ